MSLVQGRTLGTSGVEGEARTQGFDEQLLCPCHFVICCLTAGSKLLNRSNLQEKLQCRNERMPDCTFHRTQMSHRRAEMR